MAHGTIPVVVSNGGPAATVRDGIDGYHYDSVEGLAARTAELLSRTEDELRPMREMARSRAQQFSREAFGEALALISRAETAYDAAAAEWDDVGPQRRPGEPDFPDKPGPLDAVHRRPGRFAALLGRFTGVGRRG